MTTAQEAIDPVEERREELERLAQSDLPVAKYAAALLDTTEAGR